MLSFRRLVCTSYLDKQISKWTSGFYLELACVTRNSVVSWESGQLDRELLLDKIGHGQLCRQFRNSSHCCI